MEPVEKGPVSYGATPMMDHGTGWDGPAAVQRMRKWASKDGSGDPAMMDWAKYRKGFTWVDGASSETFGAYKMPHHDIVDGEMKVNFAGCSAAMAAMSGARGGVDMPTADMGACHEHLAKHYKQFGEEPPPMKTVQFDGVGVKALTAGGHVKAAGSPDAGDLDLINTYALVKLKASDVSVYTMQVANDQIDRDNERFAPEVLADFAMSLVGKSLLEGHNWGPVGIGKFYRAWVTAENGVTWLMAKCYLLNADESAQDMITKLNGGVASFVSVGFYCPDRVMVLNTDGSSYGEYRRGLDGTPAEAIEASLVFLGAQYDAQVVKGVTDRLRAAREKAHEGGVLAVFRKVLEAVGIVAKQGRVLSEENLGRLKQAVELSDQADTLVAQVIEAEVGGQAPNAADVSGAERLAQAAKDAKDAEVAALAAAEAETNQKLKESEMDQKQIDEIKAEFKAGFDALTAKYEELSVKVGELVASQVKTAEDVKAIAEDKSGDEILEKVLDRVETIEAVLGAPTAAPAEPAAEPKPEAKKTTRELFGKILRPAELVSAGS